MHEFEPLIFTCPFCGKTYLTHVIAILHYEICPEKPHMRKLSAKDYQGLLNRAGEIQAKVDKEREARHGN